MPSIPPIEPYDPAILIHDEWTSEQCVVVTLSLLEAAGVRTVVKYVTGTYTERGPNEDLARHATIETYVSEQPDANVIASTAVPLPARG